MLNSSLSPPLAALVAALTLTACNPTYNWREVRGADAPYSITLPAKPASASRPINLDGTRVTMSMTAAEVNNVTFAVGAIELPDSAKAQAALNMMKTALVKNINGTIRQQKVTGPAEAPTEIAIEAVGTTGGKTGGQPQLLIARFIAKDNRAYQVIVVGKEQNLSREAADTFLTSFKPD